MRSWAVIAALVFLAFYAACAGQFSVTETVAMIIPVAAALALTFAIHRACERRFDLRAPWGQVATRTCASIARDTVKVASVLLRCLWRRPRHATGRTNLRLFYFGDDSAPQATRRALVNLAVSASPNQYVIEMTRDDVLLTHSLAGDSRQSDPQWPI